MQRKIAIFLGVVIGVLFGFSGVFSQEDAIQVQAGSKFVVVLKSNATTGYSWHLAEPLDKEMLELVSQRYIIRQSSMVGAGGKEEWKFKALKSGRTRISFKYVRPWEKDGAPAKTESFLVIIE